MNTPTPLTDFKIIKTHSVLMDVFDERFRQYEQFGQQDLPNGTSHDHDYVRDRARIGQIPNYANGGPGAFSTPRDKDGDPV